MGCRTIENVQNMETSANAHILFLYIILNISSLFNSYCKTYQMQFLILNILPVLFVKY